MNAHVPADKAVIISQVVDANISSFSEVFLLVRQKFSLANKDIKSTHI